MLSRLFQIAAVLLLASAIVSCSRAKPAAQAPRPTSPSPSNAGALAPVAAVKAPKAPAKASALASTAVVVLGQPPKSSGGLIPSSWRQPGGSDSDRSIWENFMFETDQTITELRWRGGYDPAKAGAGGPVRNFTVDIYPSIPTGSEPNTAVAPLVHYAVGDNAGERSTEVIGNVQTHEYRFALPIPFEAAALTSYWVQIVAFQSGDPDWGFSVGSLGDGRHFRLSGAPGEGYYHQLVPEDVALQLLASGEGVPTPGPEVARSLEEIAAQMANLPPAEKVSVNAQGIQEVMLVVSRSGYTPVHFAVKPGIPVRVVFRQLGYVPGGNELNIRWGPREGTYVMLSSLTDKKVIEFTPQEPGDYRFSCPHEWYWGVMTVQK
ncbi:MAG: hypothetical protein MUC51_17640 [Anaerolineae bacterium]|nr:hypothetical protein [Anaerolineae bacterium]